VVVGVEPGGAVGGWLVLARCWALRNQARKSPLGGFSWGWGLFVLCLLRCLLAVCWWVGLVGGVFDMWIVDASIWRQPVRLVGVFSWLVGGLLSFVL